MKKFMILSGMLSSYLYGSDNPAYQELVEKYKRCLSGASTAVEEMECTEEYLIWGFEGCRNESKSAQEREVKECRIDRDKCLDRAQGKETKEKECYVREKECRESAKDTFEKSEKQCKEVSVREQKSIDKAVSELGKTLREPLGLGGSATKKK